ncbi:DUF3516 domain-containing protein, partial [Arthrobacter sp.]
AGPSARGPALLHITEGPDQWKVRQVLADPDGNHDWSMTGTVDLEASNEAGAAVVRLEDFSRM